MSDSRLEKFIYAICSMDVSDLPVPLSRIEKLWNCLITGETPDFEPLSRNEKYLMAMLDRYDISNLPAPMSRSEKLLYKIAVGETDLSDVPGYLSRYEELLKYLIENGGISGGDFEYVLHTLNQSMNTLYTTAEKPVKSAILKGQTLVNLAQSTNLNGEYVFRDNYENLMFPCNMIKPSTTYTIISNIIENSANFLNLEWSTTLDECAFKEVIRADGSLGIRKFKVTSKDDLSNASISIRFFPNNKQENGTLTITFMILEGDYTNIDIPPYFDGMQSVKMPVLTTTGKNLFDGEWEIGGIDNNGLDNETTSNIRSVNYINVEPNTDYVASSSQLQHANVVVWYAYDKNKNLISLSTTSRFFTTPSNCEFIRVRTFNSDSTNMSLDCVLQIEQGSITTSYEPYKSNILTVNEPVELRGIGDVQDMLNCLTGEVVNNFSTYRFSDNDNWSTNTETNCQRFTLNVSPAPVGSEYSDDVCIISDRLSGVKWSGSWKKVNAISCNNNVIAVHLPLGTTIEQCKELMRNSIAIYRTTESVKTVDLTVVDQDNRPTQLGTFENITHVSLEAENVVPTVEMEVATNLLEDTVFNLTDAFNTLYPTAAKPVVDGKLYGRTLVNLASEKNTSIGGDKNTTCVLPYKIDKMTVYFLNPAYSKFQYFEYNNDGTYKQALTLNIPSDRVIFISSDNTIIGKVGYYNPNDINTSKNIVVMYGDTRDIKITKYFEGMQSVQAPGVTMTNEDNTKSITLSTPSDLELRKVGEVRDEVNVMTGEVVERVGEVVLDGSEDWSGAYETTNAMTFRTPLRDCFYSNQWINDTLKNDSGFKQVGWFYIYSETDRLDEECCGISDNKYLHIRILKSRLNSVDDNGFKSFLSQNPITVQYKLATPANKTVDLSIVNQDGNETKLRTFDDTTHVLLNSEGLIPTASLTVRTKIPSGSSTSLLMDDISTEQQQLSETVDEQSENVDATMIATTEIYEETL